MVVSAARDKTVRSWNRTKENEFQQQNVYLGHSQYVNAVTYLPPSDAHPNGMPQGVVANDRTLTNMLLIGLIASSGADTVINIYDVNHPEEPCYTLIGHTANVCSLVVTAAGDLISGSWDQ